MVCIRSPPYWRSTTVRPCAESAKACSYASTQSQCVHSPTSPLTSPALTTPLLVHTPETHPQRIWRGRRRHPRPAVAPSKANPSLSSRDFITPHTQNACAPRAGDVVAVLSTCAHVWGPASAINTDQLIHHRRQPRAPAMLRLLRDAQADPGKVTRTHSSIAAAACGAFAQNGTAG